MAPAGDVPQPTFSDFRPETLRGTAGFVRVGQTRTGLWWLLDPQDRPFFSCGLEGVGRSARPPGAEESRTSAESVLARLCTWRVNTLGAGTSPEFFDRGIYYMEMLDFRKLVPEATIKLGGALLPDVFDQRWIEACHRRAAEVCPPRRESGGLIGYFTDHEPGWAQPPEAAARPRIARPSLLQICLSLEPGFPAYHAAWEFALAAHGDLAALAPAWEVALTNKEALRQLTQADTPLLSAGYRRDNERFSREFARSYFSICAAAIRQHDPNHLILGCRFGGPPGAAVLAECVHPHVDILSVHDGRDPLTGRLDEYGRDNTRPILIGGLSWPGRPGLERRLATVVAHPAVVGYAWERQPGRPGDLPPAGRGLVPIDDREAGGHTELLSAINARAEQLHRASAS